jgi:hypothetical protein
MSSYEELYIYTVHSHSKKIAKTMKKYSKKNLFPTYQP